MKKRVLILGAGFGGMNTVLGLHKLFHGKTEIEIIIVNETNYFLFTPLLHEVATGGISQYNITIPVRRIMECCIGEVCQDKVQRIDLDRQMVLTATQEISYDYLVVGLGAKTNFYSVEGAQENCFGLKTLKDAVTLRNHFIDVFEAAVHLEDPKERKKMLNFVVVGGGATGVELVAEMEEYFFETFEVLYKNLDCEKDVTVTLVQSGDELLERFEPHIRKKALKHLKSKDVEIRLNTKVTKVGKNYVELNSGTTIESNTIIWTAGVKPIPPIFTQDIQMTPEGQIPVEDTLQLKNYPNVFVLGDMAQTIDKETHLPIPMLAQVATRQAYHVAKNIKQLVDGKNTVPFTYKSLGSLVSLGQWMALGHVKGIKVSGKAAWWLWRTVYLTKFISKAKRLKIAIDWTVNIFLPRDISKV